MATSDDQTIKFMIKYGVSKKILSHQVHEFANIYDMIRTAFQPTILAQGFTVQFLHKDLCWPWLSNPTGRSKKQRADSDL